MASPRALGTRSAVKGVGKLRCCWKSVTSLPDTAAFPLIKARHGLETALREIILERGSFESSFPEAVILASR